MATETSGELTAGEHQLHTGRGFVGRLIVHIAASEGVWRVWDGIGMDPPACIIWAVEWDNILVAAGQIVEINFPFENGLFVEIPPGGVCSISWDEVVGITGEPPTPVPTYEYKSEVLTGTDEAAKLAHLNELGAQGWQLLFFEGMTSEGRMLAWFMRPV